MTILVHVSAFVFSKISGRFSKMVLLVCTPSELGTVPSILFSGIVYLRLKGIVP